MPSSPVGRAVEEAAVDALEGRALALVGALHRELALRQRVAGHLDAAEAAAPGSASRNMSRSISPLKTLFMQPMKRWPLAMSS